MTLVELKFEEKRQRDEIIDLVRRTGRSRQEILKDMNDRRVAGSAELNRQIRWLKADEKAAEEALLKAQS